MKQHKSENKHGRYSRLCEELSGISFMTKDGSIHPEPFAAIGYDQEIRIKNSVISRYLSETTGLETEPVVISPMPRHYRTTTKRKIHRLGGRSLLSLNPSEPWLVKSLLEPLEHDRIYRFIETLLTLPRYKILTRHLNFVICRGTYDRFMVILNVDLMDADIVRALKSMGDEIHEKHPDVLSCFAFHDPTRSAFYFESTFPDAGVRLKRLYGPGQILFSVNNATLACPPTAFSQVNLSLVPSLCNCVKDMLSPNGNERLADLFCGYGLFSIVLSDLYHDIIGIDLEKSAIDAARETMKRKNYASARYHSRAVDPDAIHSIIQANRIPLHVILDPPRNGCEPGIIPALVSRRPQSVAHLFCNVENVPSEINEWKREGYRPVRCVPFDMFPGTPHLEVVVLLEP